MDKYGMSVRQYNPGLASNSSSKDTDQYTSSSASTTSSSESSSGRSNSPPALHHNHQLIQHQQPGFVGFPQPQFGLQPWTALPSMPSLWDMDNNNTSLTDPTWNNNNLLQNKVRISHFSMSQHSFKGDKLLHVSFRCRHIICLSYGAKLPRSKVTCHTLLHVNTIK